MASDVTDKQADATQTRTRKGGQSRIKLKNALRQLLEQSSYRELRVVDITQQAGVATGLFYHYFADLPSLIEEVLRDYVAEVANTDAVEAGIEKGDWYQRIYAYNHMVALSYATRPGLMQNLLQFADETPDFSMLLRNNFIEQLMWLVQLMPHLFERNTQSEHERLMVIYTLAGSAEVLLRDYYINKVDALVEQAFTVEQMAELLSSLFYRGLFLDNPPLEKLSHFKQLSALKR
jgi:AcrR family transcriptional regulator